MWAVLLLLDFSPTPLYPWSTGSSTPWPPGTPSTTPWSSPPSTSPSGPGSWATCFQILWVKTYYFVGKIKHLFYPTLERPICRLEMRKALNSRHKSPFPVTKCLLFLRDRVLLGHPGAGQLRAHSDHLDVRRVPPGHRPPPPHPHHRRDYQHQDRVWGPD